MVYESLWLFLCGQNDTKPGSELKPERVEFGAGLSSDSGDVTQSYSGRMVLAKKTDTSVTIRMENVHFKIKHGEYILNGNLVATQTDN